MSVENKNKLIAPISMAIVAFLVYLVMRRFVLSDKLVSEDYIIAGAIAVGLVIGQIFSERRKSKKQ